jgi:hypothetical protein
MNKKNLPALLILLLSLTCKAQQWNGLTYYSTSGSTSGYLIDTSSTTVKTWTFSGGTGYSTHMIPGGTLYRTVANSGNVITGGGVTGRIQKVDYNGTILWDYVLSNANEVLHHDHCVMPNGNVLVIVYDVKSQAQLSAAGCSNSTLTSMQAEKVLELKPVGTNSAQIVWQWNVWDHLVQNVNSSASNYQTSIVNHPELLNINYLAKKDWMHMNGIDYNPILDQIVVSSHNLNEWYIIDHSTTTAEAATHSGGLSGKGGDFLYRWGNPPAYGASGTKILDVTHDSHWIPEGSPGAGNIAGVNNKGVASGPKTTIDAVIPPRSGLNYTISVGSAFSPATYDTRHTSTGYTSNMGSSDQFPNGNQMICLATAGTIYEIDAAGNTLWTKSTGGACPQSHRYTQCYIDFAAPAQPSISVSGSNLMSTSATTYQWYVNGDLIVGATNQTITPSQNGMYVVRTTDVNGCVYVYSAGYMFGTSTGLKYNSEINSVQIYPNPSTGLVKFKLHPNYSYRITVSDMNGKQVMTEGNTEEIDLSALNNGIYIITVSNEVLGSTTKKISIIK